MKVSATPAWQFICDEHGKIDPVLLKLLAQIQQDARLTTAAATCNISYRHAWNIIKKWNKNLGQALVEQRKGQGTALTPLGEKLLWAEQLIDAHLSPQISTLNSTINRELNELLGRHESLLRVHASHGYAVDILPNLVAESEVYSIDIKYMGSVAAVKSLVDGECELAGFHLCQHPLLKTQVSASYQNYLDNTHYSIIRLVLRQQGLIIQKNNPKNIRFLSDLIDPTIQFINRQPTSGTRLLFDELLNTCKLNPKNITGYKDEEFTHTAVAAHVASGAADVGFGIEYAARKFNLEFIPIVSEQYVLACREELIPMSALQYLLQTLENHHFADKIYQLPGYHLDSPGKLISAQEFLA